MLANQECSYSVALPIIGAAVCFAIRMVGLHCDLNLPAAKDVRGAVDPWRLRRRGRSSR